MITDEERLKKVIKIIPEAAIDDILQQLYYAYIDRKYLVALNDLVRYGGTIESGFSNEELNSHLRELLSKTTRLYSHIKKNFFSNSDPDRYILRPELKKSGAKIERNNWTKHNKQLQQLCKDFEESYNVFLKVAYSPRSNSEPITTSGMIHYHPASGTGSLNRKTFKFKDHQPEYRVFSALFQRVGQMIPRLEILRLIYNDPEYQTENWAKDSTLPQGLKSVSYKKDTEKINDVVVKIRKVSGLSTTALVNNNGNLTLIEKLETGS